MIIMTKFLEEDAKTFGRETVGYVACRYLIPNVYIRRFLDTQYGMRKDGNIFNICDSAVLVDQDGDTTIKENEFRGFKGVWELLTLRTVNEEHVTSQDMRTYKKISLLTNAHLEGYQTGGAINVSRGKKFRKSSPPFREAQNPRCRTVVTPCTKKYKDARQRIILQSCQTVSYLDCEQALCSVI